MVEGAVQAVAAVAVEKAAAAVVEAAGTAR